MPTRFLTSAQRPDLLGHALGLTLSSGFMPDAVAIGAWRGSQPLSGPPDAVAVFQNATVEGAEVHFGLQPGSRLNADMIRGFLNYAFRHRRFPRLVGPIPAWNTRAQAAALHAGFVVVGYIAAGPMRDRDVVVMQLAPAAEPGLPPQPDDDPTEAEPAPTMDENEGG